MKAVVYEGLVGQLDLLTTLVVNIVRAAGAKTQLVHDAKLQAVRPEEVSSVVLIVLSVVIICFLLIDFYFLIEVVQK